MIKIAILSMELFLFVENFEILSDSLNYASDFITNEEYELLKEFFEVLEIFQVLSSNLHAEKEPFTYLKVLTKEFLEAR